MLQQKNIKPGKIEIYFIILILFFFPFSKSQSSNELEGTSTDIKVLDKISSKNALVKLKNGEDFKYKDLLIQILM